ncbi:MAG: tetratricopeptide repeat protein [Chlamydiales bacterium]|nr:tetratricopeptide repeat protein [Chlamydiales bacterium]
MRYSRLLVNSAFLLTIPSIALYSGPSGSVANVQTCASQDQESLQRGSSPTYDGILKLFEDLESGELEKRYNERELERIANFLANLARQGILPNETAEKIALDIDIQELLYGNDNSYEYSLFLLDEGSDFISMPAIYYGPGEVVLCRSWAHKKWKQIKKFAKKHKKALIIGAAVVVAAAVVVGAVAAASAAGAAAAGSAASDGQKKDKSKEGNEGASISSANLSSDLPTAVGEQISSFKEGIAKEQFLESSQSTESSLGESGRVLGSLFAHESFKNLSKQPINHPQFEGGLGHLEIDRKFSTDYASLYSDPHREHDFNTLSYQLRGERALASGHLNQAVFDFGKAIELDPSNPLPYLERGVAHFRLGQYDNSLQDYHEYTAQAQKNIPLSVSEFSLGFAKGLPKGVYESGENLLLFISDMVKHPIQTGSQMWEALTVLSDLARTEQWSVLSEALAPEVHQLIKDWDTIPSDERGELAGYAFGKHGADIVIPGAVAKAVAKGVKGAQELNAVYKGLRTAEQTLVLESVSELGSGAKVGEALQASQKTISLAEELGFAPHEVAGLKQAGRLEETVADTFTNISKNPAARESAKRFKDAELFLESNGRKFTSENEIRALIHKTGISTFPKPVGIPENYVATVSNKGAGMKYVHPKNAHTYVRVMPGKPHSPFPYQQNPYVNQRVNGKSLDKHGNVVLNDSPEAHIPISEFIFRGAD